ncbi:hypothetical protein CMI37_17490 [Candidatus Pacearchaeota archaeon]|nr:hypothetical protein [Candidatus Pacearchaeota archaeon]
MIYKDNCSLVSMKYFFILGRNPDLSRVEVFSYLESCGVSFKEEVFGGNFLVLDLESDFDLDIQELGGVLKFGRVIFFGAEGELGGFLDKNEVIAQDKFSYAIFGNSDFEDILREKFKAEKKRAMLRRGRRVIRFQADEVGNLPKADFYLFIYLDKGKVYFGLVESEFDDSGVRKRDMGKPHRREELAISPRLAKILINLAGVGKGGRLLDCFCGVGGVLQEALIRNINVVGVDNDKEAVKQAGGNLDWLKKNFSFEADYNLIVGNSGKVSAGQVGEFDGVAGEAALGEVLRRKLGKKEAGEFIRKFEKFIVPVLKNLKILKQGDEKIAMTFPVINSVHVDISGISERAGLRVLSEIGGVGVKFPILESRSDQFVSRDFVVFY